MGRGNKGSSERPWCRMIERRFSLAASRVTDTNILFMRLDALFCAAGILPLGPAARNELGELNSDRHNLAPAILPSIPPARDGIASSAAGMFNLILTGAHVFRVDSPSAGNIVEPVTSGFTANPVRLTDMDVSGFNLASQTASSSGRLKKKASC
jgi:hypothetical protein